MPKEDVKNAVLSTLRSSTIHGVSHAASTKRVPLKVMWTLLFLIFFGLFVYNVSHLVEKLYNRTLVKSYELDKVPSLFPDLYFCPSNPYSGSFPYTLTRAEADAVNAEINRTMELCRESIYCYKLVQMGPIFAAWLAQSSLPMALMSKFLVQRVSQSVLAARITTSNISYLPDLPVEGLAVELGTLRPEEAPALTQLAGIAKELASGNHSAHLEGIFRTYVSESLISVSVSAASAMSPMITMSWSYSVTMFMADTGGLLGLYIGCSLLTLGEALELLATLCGRKKSGGSGDDCTAGNKSELPPELKAGAVELEVQIS